MPYLSAPNGSKHLAQGEALFSLTNPIDSAAISSSTRDDVGFVRLGKLSEVEQNLLIKQLESVQYRQNESNFSWLSQAIAGSQMDTDLRAAARQLSLATEVSGPEDLQANVFSRLELTYAQLAQLLIADTSSSDHELAQQTQVRVQCRLNSAFSNLQRIPSASASNVHYALAHIFLEPEIWFPHELESDADGLTAGIEQLLSTGSGQPNLTRSQDPDTSRSSAALQELHINILLDSK